MEETLVTEEPVQTEIELPTADMNNALPPKITKENYNPQMGKRATVLWWIRATLVTMLASFLIAFAAYNIISPNEFTIGGATGIAILVNAATNGKVPQWAVLLCLNLPLIILSFFFVRKRFAILSTMNIGLQSFWLFLLEKIFKDDLYIVFSESEETSKIFAAVAAALCVGTAIALAFKIGGSTGGADIAAVMIQRKFKASSIAWVIFAINCIVICSSVLVFNVKNDDGSINLGATLLPIVLAAFEAYIESRTNEAITHGFQSTVEFRIITTKPDEMSLVLMKELRRGVTSTPAKGMYTKEDRSILICVVSKRQITTVQRIIKQTDPDAFAVMSKVSQVFGLGFHTGSI